MREKALKMGPGQIYSIGLSKIERSYLPSPYGTCRNDKSYRRRKCLLNCISKYVTEECECRDTFMTTDEIVCSPLDLLCVRTQSDSFLENELHKKCNCLSQCEISEYDVSISHSPGNNIYLKVASESHKIKPDYLKDNYLELNVFFTTMNIMKSTEHPAYTVLALLCDIGGAFGLMLGATILTIIQLLAEIIKLILAIRLSKNRIQVLPLQTKLISQRNSKD